MFNHHLRAGLVLIFSVAMVMPGIAAASGIQIIRGDGSPPATGHHDAGGASAAARESSGKEVVMYGASWCGYCSKARSYFQQHRIPFTEYDVEKSAKGARDYHAFGGGGLPLILIGDSGMHGFSADTFASIYYGK